MGVRLDNAKGLYMEAIQEGNYVEAINKYAGERYTQHSTPVRDGKEGFIEFFADFVERNPDRDIQILRGFEDGRHVFLHVVQILNGGEYRYVTADIFDTDGEGRLIEHWDIIEELEGDHQIDGPMSIDDSQQTDESKDLVREFIDEVWLRREHGAAKSYVSPNLIDHSKRMESDDLSLREAVYVKTHLLVGAGDFVAALSEFIQGNQTLAVIDLFRLSQGKIVEHWDVSEEIIPKDQWVNSGKF